MSSNQATHSRPADEHARRSRANHARVRRKTRKSKASRKTFKINLEKRETILKEIQRQRQQQQKQKARETQDMHHKRDSLKSQLGNLESKQDRYGQFLQTHETAFPIQQEIEHVKASLDTIEKKLHEVCPSVRSTIEQVHEEFRQQKVELHKEKLNAVDEFREKVKRERKKFSTMKSHIYPHEKCWQAPKSTCELLSNDHAYFEPNPGGKPFCFEDKSLWPMLNTAKVSHDRNLHARPWRAVPLGRLFGDPPETLLPSDKREDLKRHKLEFARKAEQKERKLKQQAMKDAQRKKKIQKKPWKQTTSAPGMLFDNCKPDRPMSYYERLNAAKMTIPDRTLFKASQHNKPPWLPTASGQLFGSRVVHAGVAKSGKIPLMQESAMHSSRMLD